MSLFRFLSRHSPANEMGLAFIASPRSRYRQLKALLELDDRLLADIGSTRSELRNGHGMRESDNPNPLRTPVLVREATADDVPAIRAIYAHHVLHGLGSFEETPPSRDEMQGRFEAVVTRGLPYLAAELGGQVVGYCYATPYRPRPAYRYAIEDSVYVDPAAVGRGVGRALLAGLIDRCEGRSWHQMIAVIGDSGNAASIGLHARLGFRRIGTVCEVGFKFARWVDTVIMQRPLTMAQAPRDRAEPDPKERLSR